MAKYFITEERPATLTWMYEVEANSETEALNKVLDGEVTSKDVYTDVDYDEDKSEYEVKQII